MVNLRGTKRLLRLGSGGSLRRSANSGAVPYPEHIVVDDDNEFRRRHDREELKFWKRKARDLEGAVEELEGKVAALEREKVLRELEADVAMVERSSCSDGGDVVTAESSTSDHESSFTSAADERGEEVQQQLQRRKDEAVQQLVSELERLIDLHTNTKSNAESDKHDISNDEGTNATSQGETTNMIDTSLLGELVSGVFKEAESAAEAATKTLSKTPKAHKEKCDLYQLTCKHCIGRNYVGSTKRDELKNRVKENFAVVWQVVRTAYGKGDGEVVESGGQHCLSFRASSFAHHVAEHCRDCNSEREVYRWCVDNIRVERISKHPFM